MTVETKEKIVFKNEEERTNALLNIQKKGANENDLEEIERITKAEIENTEPENTERTETTADDSVQQTEEKETVSEEKGRNWQITEDLIKKYDENYYDPDSKRERNYITHRTPEDLLKSFKDSQKYIRHIKDDMLPKKVAAAYEQAKAEAKTEYENHISDLQKKLDEANKRQAQPASQQKATSDLNSSDNEIDTILKTLEGVSDEDAIEHVADVKKALIVAMKKITMSKNDKEDILRQADQRAAEKFEAYKQERETELREAKKREDAEKQIQLNQQRLKDALTELDQFSSSKDFPSEFKLTGQKYDDAYKEALAFHNELAEIYTGKTKESFDPKTWRGYEEQASIDFLNKTPAMIEKFNQSGIQKPKNYEKWVFLDNIDAIKNGYFRNPDTNQWEIRYDKKTGKAIQFPDVKSAYNYYIEETGLKKKLDLKNGRKNTEGLIEAINKRDAGVVQLDESALSSSGKGQVLTEDDAIKILNTIDSTDAMRMKMNGNDDAFNKINAALVRLGQKPLEM
jgi:hypothetical protein